MSISDWSSDVCSSDLHFKIIFQIKIEIPLHFPGHQPVRPAVITPETDIKRFGSIDHRYFGAFSSQLADIQFPLGKITDVRRLLPCFLIPPAVQDRKSTRLNSSH